ncbi:MAG: hypothetical protein Q6354_09120 [Candidatus Brocadiales bacterium]|nr:hypothetical protein [Candidatus Brocadiales bacterium]
MLNQLLNYMDSYLVSECSLQDLESWLLSNLQKILDSGDEAATKVANQVDADLVELNEGLIDETVFRNKLESLLRQRETIVSSTLSTSTGSADKTISGQWKESTQVEVLHLTLQFA